MFLEDIVVATRARLTERKQKTPLSALKERALAAPNPLDFGAALRGDGLRLIAEVKKASPSKGAICRDLDPLKIARAYTEGGAAAISVLTEEQYFQGSLDYLSDIKKTLGESCPPLLRKDFILEPYQVYEARAYGADSLLLIAAILSQQALHELLWLSRELGMQCLVEAHNEAEIGVALECGADIIGINNRDLATFKVDIEVTRRLRPLIPPGKIVVAESGIRTAQDMRKMRSYGVNAVLVGEALVKAPDIGAKMRELLG